MDSANQRAVTPGKSRLVRTFAKVLHIQAGTGVAPIDGIQKAKFHENVKHEDLINGRPHCFDDDNLRKRAAVEGFLASMFASISAVKAAYAQLQFSQIPYDASGIQSADQRVVSELKNLSEMKQCYMKKQFNESSPETTQFLAEVQEQRSLLITCQIMGKKLDYELQLKNSEITFLEEKLVEANGENKLLDKRLNLSRHLSVLDNLHLSGLRPSHFVTVLGHTIKSIRTFVRLMIIDMESSGWDLDAAVSSIQPGIGYLNTNHRCYAFESFVCREMFDGFNCPNFYLPNESFPEQKKHQRLFFDRFKELKSMKPKEYIALNPISAFAKFCYIKYLRLVHPKMELFLSGNLNQRNLVSSGEYPETKFFTKFAQMAKSVWLLHRLAFSFEPEVSTFQVRRGGLFSEVYMKSVNNEALLSSDSTSESDPRVAFTVVPGFRIGITVIQCQVYLS
ncbi:protein GRAVITROPIC IN THE LIGHT 1-like [Cornus florida]|uniref:protein GRAVITROPIC IN THE LIGHT 1-like n=1 Tax=Cornus florida TaxID=4283 RepID=UPI002898E3B5|nr:protein GRAVITROPIC IN THE LIGHT 1-like [Cornus florida]